MPRLHDWLEIPPSFPRHALATTVIILLCWVMVWVLTNSYPQENARIVFFMAGNLTAFAGQIVSYYFGDTQQKTPRSDKQED